MTGVPIHDSLAREMIDGFPRGFTGKHPGTRDALHSGDNGPPTEGAKKPPPRKRRRLEGDDTMKFSTLALIASLASGAVPLTLCATASAQSPGYMQGAAPEGVVRTPIAFAPATTSG